jgi:predicted GNAT family N-acyltransferase
MPGASVIKVNQVQGDDELAQAIALQQRVFHDEQGISAVEVADGNTGAVHVIACDSEGQVVATARLSLTDSDLGIIARVAVLPESRGAGVGPLLVQGLEDIARAAGKQRITLEPHESLEDFYSDLGYRRVSGLKHVGPHQLITMEKRLDK